MIFCLLENMEKIQWTMTPSGGIANKFLIGIESRYTDGLPWFVVYDKYVSYMTVA